MWCRAFVICIWLTAVAPAPAKTKTQAPQILRGMGEVHHPVSTENAKAQQFFDQGLALIYGFNHEGAGQSFKRAAELDPDLAMAWWGIALSLGPNINVPVDLARENQAYEAIQRALSLLGKTSQAERAYIQALAFRYSNDPKADLHQFDIAYRDAMAKLVKQYPDDLDATTLYAESIMDLHPWRLWSHEGKPNEGTEEIVAMLESVLERDPNHLGANHYYIHAVEGSPYPGHALASAARLEKLAPAAGHLVHMPSHIYARVGDHAASLHCNEQAVNADRKYLAANGPSFGAIMYHAHNLHFLAYAASMSGDFVKAKRAADDVAVIAGPHAKEMPEMEGFLSSFACSPEVVLIAFEKWNDILKLPAPDASLAVLTAAWHFARGMAFANLGNVNAVQQEEATWRGLIAKISPEMLVDETNKIDIVFKIQGNLLSAAIARARHDDKGAIEFLNNAVAAENSLNYAEPPAFYPPVRPLLGRALMDAKQFAEAEKVFREDLERHPRNRRALIGLRDSLQAQKRAYEAAQIELQLRKVEGKIDKVTSRRRK